ncbi:HNH endonuclease [Exiguobacterium undae]
MAFIKQAFRITGQITGTVIGTPVKLIGKQIGSEFIEDIGNTVKTASVNTGTLLGAAAEGTWNTASGFVQKDEDKIQEGLDELKRTGYQGARGISQAVTSTVQSSRDVIGGIRDEDKERIIRGAKGLGKTVAVATLTVGVLDILDVIDPVEADAVSSETLPNATDHYIETRNDELLDSTHPVTGVAFHEQIIELPSGEHLTGVFPAFDSVSDVQLNEGMYLESDYVQFSYANAELAHQIDAQTGLENQFTDAQIEQIYLNQTPDGYTWHHSETPGNLQLVEEEAHAHTGHTGGRELWGGGEAFR